MSAQRASILIFLIVVPFCVASTASDVELKLGGSAQAGNLSAGNTQSHVLSLTAGDFAQVSIETHGSEFVVIAYGPSGNKVRGFEVGPDDARR